MRQRHLKPRAMAARLSMSTGRPPAKVRVGEVPCIKLGKGLKAHIRFDPGAVIKPLQANG
jgi:hypothetical protein